MGYYEAVCCQNYRQKIAKLHNCRGKDTQPLEAIKLTDVCEIQNPILQT